MRPAEAYRQSFLEGDTKRDEGLTTPEDIVRMDDLSYGPYGEDSLMDIYYPKAKGGLNPTIVSVHGGAWVSGGKNTYQYYCMNLAQHGFTVVNCNYRRAPETRFPSTISDVNDLFAWIMQHGAEYHIDTDNLFLVGDSSGAQVSSQYLALLTNPAFASLFPFTAPEGLRIRACALNCGVYDAKTYLLTDAEAPIHYYVPDMTPEALEMMHTTKYITQDFPPTYVVSANRDFLQKNAKPMYELLQSLGVPATLQIFGTEEKPQGHVFHLDIRNDQATVCNDNECAFFAQYIH